MFYHQCSRLYFGKLAPKAVIHIGLMQQTPLQLKNKLTTALDGKNNKHKPIPPIKSTKTTKVLDWGDSDSEPEDATINNSSSLTNHLRGANGLSKSSSKPVSPELLLLGNNNNSNKQPPNESPVVAVVSEENLVEMTDEVEDLINIEDDYEPFSMLREPTEEEVEVFHTQQVANLNGNWNNEGEFKEWHETVTVSSYQEELLHILPYTIVDF